MTETQIRSSTFGIVMLLGTLTAFAPMSIDMYLPAFPAIGRDLQTTPQAVQTSLAIFFAGLAFGQFFVEFQRYAVFLDDFHQLGLLQSCCI